MGVALTIRRNFFVSSITIHSRRDLCPRDSPLFSHARIKVIVSFFLFCETSLSSFAITSFLSNFYYSKSFIRYFLSITNTSTILHDFTIARNVVPNVLSVSLGRKLKEE